MKLKYLFLGVILILFFSPTINTFASEQDFYFEDFTADYYLTKLEDGTSNLHVREMLTAVFPMSNQNHGIMRTIPYANQGGENRTITDESAMNFTVLRNGEPENINKIEAKDGYYVVYIGSADRYVQGEQIYTLEYDYTDVITEFDKNGNNVSGVEDVEKVFQELYWDTNGTGWSQRFDKLTANFHVMEDIYKNMEKEAWCYVGKYSEKGKNRCVITSTEDGFSFTTENLMARENLTFVAKFKPDTFKVILEKNYILVILLACEVVLMVSLLTRKYLKWRKTAKSQYDLYKATFVAPQYQPPKDESVFVAEGEQAYIKKTKTSYVATLLELVVNKKVTIKKVDEDDYDWVVTMDVEPEEISASQRSMMEILSGTGSISKGNNIPIQKHKPTRKLAECAESYKDNAIYVLERNGYFKNEKTNTKKNKFSNFITIVVFLSVFLVISNIKKLDVFIDNLLSLKSNSIMIGADFIPLLIFAILVGWIIVGSILRRQTNKYKKYTENGIQLVRYLEGLELYIKMAEKDRIEFLQSVKGADVSNEGIVKLYEKLLPWASLFGVEESWIKELSKYYEIEDVDGVMNSDILNGIMISNISHDINRSINYSTHYVEPSSAGGSWSSSSGGSSGGGFSGGGGGGGGGGGW